MSLPLTLPVGPAPAPCLVAAAGAAQELSGVLAEDPTDATAANNLALCYLYSADLEGATRTMELAFRRAPAALLQVRWTRGWLARGARQEGEGGRSQRPGAQGAAAPMLRLRVMCHCSYPPVGML